MATNCSIATTTATPASKSGGDDRDPRIRTQKKDVQQTVKGKKKSATIEAVVHKLE
jgi:hypothetical protein